MTKRVLTNEFRSRRWVKLNTSRVGGTIQPGVLPPEFVEGLRFLEGWGATIDKVIRPV